MSSSPSPPLPKKPKVSCPSLSEDEQLQDQPSNPTEEQGEQHQQQEQTQPQAQEQDDDEEEEDPEEQKRDEPTSRPPLPLPPGTSKPRYKRRKLAIFLAYCGHGYQGMQKNPGAKTIESDLENALHLSFAVPDSDRSLPRRYDWARAARTDKGVSAAGQVVSGRFYVDPPGLVDRLNSHLPSQIRVFGYKRVTASFNAKKFCDRRRYVYLLPVLALDPEAHPDRESVLASLGSGNELAKCLECSERGRKVPGVIGRRVKGDAVRVEMGGGGENGEVGIHEERSELGGDGLVGENRVEVGAEGEKGEVEGNMDVGFGCMDVESKNCEEKSELGGGMGSGEGEGLVGRLEDGSERRPSREDGEEVEKGKVGTLGEGREIVEERKQLREGGPDKDGVEVRSHVERPELNNNACCNSVPLGYEFVAVSNGAEVTVKHVDDGFEKDSAEVRRCLVERPELNGNGCGDSAPLGYGFVAVSNGAEVKDVDDVLDASETQSTIEVSARKLFEYGEKEKERFNKILKRYVGTHNFHNFTTRTKAEDPSARRYILSFDADSVVNIDGIDFVKCVVLGQSFMLHQIRKMIGLAVAIMRNCTPESIMDSALRKDVSINVPTAPEVGLYLEECLFSSYNQKWKDSHEELSMHSYAKEAEDFKMKFIYPHIASMEQKEGSVALWLHSLNRRNYPDFHFEESTGTNSTAASVEVSSQADRMVE